MTSGTVRIESPISRVTAAVCSRVDPFGHINNDLEFALVVKGQHLHTDHLEGEKGKGRQKQNDDEAEKSVAPEGGMDQRRHDPAVKLCAPPSLP